MEIKHLAEHVDAIPTIATWVHEQWGHNMPPDVGIETLVSMFEKRMTQGRIPETFVAINGGAPVGTASLVKHDMAERRDLSPWLAAVYVAPRFRNRGIGSALVRAVMQEAKTLDVDRLYLFTPDRMSFYGRLGWQVLERAQHRGVDVTIMGYEFQ